MKPPKTTKGDKQKASALGEMEFHWEHYKRLKVEAHVLRERAKLIEQEADAHMVFFGTSIRKLRTLVSGSFGKGGAQ